ARADDADAHAGFRSIPAAEHVVQVANAGSMVDDARRQNLWRHHAFHHVLDRPAAGVLKGVPRQLGNRRRDPRLLGGVESEARGDLLRALARRDDVVLVADADGQEPTAHAASRPTTTVTSSRPRA